MTKTIPEQLTEYVARRFPDQITASAGKPWTFHYRQWTDAEGRKCSQCTSVTIETRDGPTYNHTVSDMDAYHTRSEVA